MQISVYTNVLRNTKAINQAGGEWKLDSNYSDNYKKQQ